MSARRPTPSTVPDAGVRMETARQLLERQAADAELRSQLVRAWLAGYGRAIADFEAHANRQTGTRLSRGLRRILHRRDSTHCREQRG